MSQAAIALDNAAVSELTSTLEREFHPAEVILFGSRAYGTPRTDSDADLLVIVGDGAKPLRSHLVVLQTKSGMEAHVHAFTIRGLRNALVHGNTAVRDALLAGVLIYPGRGKSRFSDLQREWTELAAAQEWLARASGDISAAETLLTNAQSSEVVANLCQQGAEKALKGIIVHLGGDPAKVHDLQALLQQVSALDAVAGQAAPRLLPRAQRLQPYAVTVRYPGVSTTRKEAQQALRDAKAIWRFAKDRLP